MGAYKRFNTEHTMCITLMGNASNISLKLIHFFGLFCPLGDFTAIQMSILENTLLLKAY